MLHWLPIPSRIGYRIDILCHTALTTAYPKHLSEHLNVCTSARPLRSSSDPNMLTISTARTKSYGERAFAYQGPNNWDRILGGIGTVEENDTSKEIINAKKYPGLLESLRCHSIDEYPVLSEDDPPIPPLACSFSKVKNTEHILALVDENGSVVWYNTNMAGEKAVLLDWLAHNNAIFNVEWMCEEEKFLTASGDQTVALWDAATKTKILSFKGHTSSVKSVQFRPSDDAVFATGSRDGHIRIWDKRSNAKGEKASSVSLIKNAHSVSESVIKKKKSWLGNLPAKDLQQSVTCVAYQNDYLLASSGAVDGCVKIWDSRHIKPDNNVAIYNFPYAGSSKRTHGFSSLTFDSYFSSLYANCTDDIIYCYNLINYNPHPVGMFKGHTNSSFYEKSVLSPDNKFLLSGSSDENAYIWQIVTTSDNNSIHVWRFDPFVECRKKMFHAESSYGITGWAEQTHRDIGTSVEPTSFVPKLSLHSTLKRAATIPFGPVAELAAKRARTSLISTPSPSIKLWLKRSDSEVLSITSVSVENSVQELNLNDSSESRNTIERETGLDLKLGSKGLSEDMVEIGACSSPKRRKIGMANYSFTEKATNTVNKYDLQMKSCKRRLVDNTQSPVKVKKPKGEENSENLCDGSATKKDCGKKACDSLNVSPSKRQSVLKDLHTHLNQSPSKQNANVLTQKFSSSVRFRNQFSAECNKSPTANLPNLLIDRRQKVDHDPRNEYKKKAGDWLTQIRIQKLTKQSPQDKVGGEKITEKCSEKFVSGDTSSQESEKSLTPSKIKSPLRGIRSTTSFFAPKSDR